VNQHFNARKRSGIPDQKGVLEMIRGLPENYLFPGNNKVWHGIVAWHFCLFLIVRMSGPLLEEDRKRLLLSSLRKEPGQ
jgi:hypothetical protein